jgi:hypothetical protein
LRCYKNLPNLDKEVHVSTGELVTRGERGQFQSWAAALAERARRAIAENDALMADAIAFLGLAAYRAWAATLNHETILGTFSFNKALRLLLGRAAA